MNKVDHQTAEFLKHKAKTIRSIESKAATEIGKHLKEVRDRLGNPKNGVYMRFLDSIGYNRQQGNRLIQRYDFVTKCDRMTQERIEKLPISLTYEIARPSANPEAVEAVKRGEIKTLKQWKAFTQSELSMSQCDVPSVEKVIEAMTRFVVEVKKFPSLSELEAAFLNNCGEYDKERVLEFVELIERMS